MSLPLNERRVLEAVCDTLLPALDAATLGVPAAMEQALARMPLDSWLRFRLLLRMLEQPLAMRVLAGSGTPFTGLPLPAREQALLRLAGSRVGALRGGFGALKHLACFLFYSLPGPDGANPAWPAIGYRPPVDDRHAPASLGLTLVDRPTTIECDVCVIGSGAGGGVVAAQLAAAGRRVVVLEAGGGEQAPDYRTGELDGMRRLYLDAGLSSSHDLGVTILAGATLGGGTTVNWQTSLRLPDQICEEWAARSGCSLFVEPSFSESFAAVEARLNVGVDESAVNRHNAVLREGSAALGWRWSLVPRNAQDCAFDRCGFCVFGCPHAAKRSTAVTFLVDAQAGDTCIVPRCRAEQVMIQNGRVTGVRATAFDPATGQRHSVRVAAPLVVVAAGALGSPALLMRSGIRHPQLGRNLFLHPTSAVAAEYREPIQAWHGPPQTVLCDEFAMLHGQYGFRVEVAPAHPGLLALATPWSGPRAHRRNMQHAGCTAALIGLVRDRESGRVRLGRDGRPIVEYRPAAFERRMLQESMVAMTRIHAAAGARRINTTHERGLVLERPADRAELERFCAQLRRLPPSDNWAAVFSAHQMGTCRMGAAARDAVCDENGAVWGVRGLFVADGSLFPLASGVNPQLTIMALAHHIAQRIKQQTS